MVVVTRCRGGGVADCCMGSLIVVPPQPLRSELLRLLDRMEDMPIQPFVPNRPVKPLDVSVLGRFSRLNIHQRYTLGIRPVNQRLSNVLRAVVQTDRRRLASPLDHLFQCADHTLARQRQIHLNGQALTIVIIKHVERA